MNNAPEQQPQTENEEKFTSFSAFYPYYLSEHSNPTCRLLHFVGSFLIIALITYVLFSGTYILLWLVPIIGYGFAWVGHFFFEHNKPATFTYPLYSLLGDWVMFKDILIGRISLQGSHADKA